MSLRSWAARVQAAMAERARPKPQRGMQLARQAIIVGVGLIGTGVLLYLLFFAPMPGGKPAAPPAVSVTLPPVNPPARDVNVPAQAQVPATVAKPAAKAAAPAPAVAAPEAPLALTTPLAGRVLIPFGWAYSPTLEDWRLHGGLSIAGASGAPVHAAAAGTVLSVAQDPLWGRMVVVDDGNGVQTEYASLETVSVQQGQQVKAGEVIGTVGDTAAVETSLGPHLYFALVQNGQAVNPSPLLSQPSD